MHPRIGLPTIFSPCRKPSSHSRGVIFFHKNHHEINYEQPQQWVSHPSLRACSTHKRKGNSKKCNPKMSWNAIAANNLRAWIWRDPGWRLQGLQIGLPPILHPGQQGPEVANYWTPAMSYIKWWVRECGYPTGHGPKKINKSIHPFIYL